jgi:hypothetical protein
LFDKGRIRFRRRTATTPQSHGQNGRDRGELPLLLRALPVEDLKVNGIRHRLVAGVVKMQVVTRIELGLNASGIVRIAGSAAI